MQNQKTTENTFSLHSESESSYKTGEVLSYQCLFYTIKISKLNTKSGLNYDAFLILEKKFDFIEIKDKFIKFLKSNFTDITSEFGFIKLENLLYLLKTFFKSIQFQHKDNLKNEIDFDQILLFWAYLAGFNKILPLLLDQNVEEIFISPNTENISIDHYVYGRLTTNFLISEKEKENLLYRTALENSLELNQLKPSLKGDLQVSGVFSLRITGDIKPFSYDGTIINIRKLNQRQFNLETLIKLNSIDSVSSAFLKTLISNGVNITIIGSPSSGKTTLQNALLRELPPYWRVFSIENTLETNIKQPNFFRFKIFDYMKSQNKDLRIIFSQLLHRSPDYVNLGEITTEEEAIAWNACTSAGIPVIQTIHSNSSSGLITRIKDVFHIPVELLASSFPHIVVEVKYFWNHNRKERRISTISEFIIENNYELKLNALSTLDIQSKKMIWLINPEKANSFIWIKENKNKEISKLYNIFLSDFKRLSNGI